MESRIAVIGIFVYCQDSSDKLNELLHEYRHYILGRMGLPYREKQVSVLSIIVDAPNDIISALSGKLGKLPQVSVKAIYSKKQGDSSDV